MKALHVMVHGRVQGVWFRASTQEEARNLGLNGWVRNTSDGGVEIHMQGDDALVEQFLNWCHQGSPGASVIRVDAEPVEPDEGIKGFTIR
jgi:acylphosphatase